MRFEGKLCRPAGKKDKFWGVEIPLLHIHTQGHTQKEAYLMARDAIETLVNRKGFRVSIFPADNDAFTIDSNDRKTFIAFLLKRNREFKQLSVRDVVKRMNSKSPNAYAQYETGRISPSIDKLIELLKAIDPAFEPVLKAA